jgi:hypothetical protein
LAVPSEPPVKAVAVPFVNELDNCIAFEILPGTTLVNTTVPAVLEVDTIVGNKLPTVAAILDAVIVAVVPITKVAVPATVPAVNVVLPSIKVSPLVGRPDNVILPEPTVAPKFTVYFASLDLPAFAATKFSTNEC